MKAIKVITEKTKRRNRDGFAVYSVYLDEPKLERIEWKVTKQSADLTAAVKGKH